MLDDIDMNDDDMSTLSRRMHIDSKTENKKPFADRRLHSAGAIPKV